MKKFLLKISLFTAFVLTIGCINKNNKVAESRLSDSASLLRGKRVVDNPFLQSEDDSFYVDDLSELKKAYVDRYADTLIIDTSISTREHPIRIILKHFCLFDSSVTIPQKYVAIYGMRDFTTHNFQSLVKISSGDEILTDTVITKKTFVHSLPVELQEFGVLLYPTIEPQQNQLTIRYSISIPLTDVGSSYAVSFDF